MVANDDVTSCGDVREDDARSGSLGSARFMSEIIRLNAHIDGGSKVLKINNAKDSAIKIT